MAVEMSETMGIHLRRSFGVDARPLHEDHGIEVLEVPPTDEYPYYRLVTAGVAAEPMPSEGEGEERFVELTIALPDTWGIYEPLPEATWPAQLLTDIGARAHAYSDGLRPGYTVPNGFPPEPYPGTNYVCALMARPQSAPDWFATVSEDWRNIELLAVIPISETELNFKLSFPRGQGGEQLLEKLAAKGVTDVVKLGRRNVVFSGVKPNTHELPEAFGTTDRSRSMINRMFGRH